MASENGTRPAATTGRAQVGIEDNVRLSQSYSTAASVWEVERDLLTILLKEPYALGHVESFDLGPVDFEATSHRSIFAAVRSIYERGDNPGLETVRAEVDRAGTLSNLDPGDIELIAAQIVAPTQLTALARRIKVESLMRLADGAAERRDYRRALELQARAESLMNGSGIDRENVVNLVTIADVEPEPVRWFWKDRIPYSGMTLVDGDPGTGKTSMFLDSTARFTTGRPMPDGTPSSGPSDVLILTVEDVLATTIRPRLEAAGADLDGVHAINGIPDGDGERPVVLPRDWSAIVAAVESTRARLVFLDPLMALVGGDVDSYRDQDARRALVPGIKAAPSRSGSRSSSPAT